GIKNTAIINFLRGDVFLVDNSTLKKFDKKEYKSIGGFIELARKEGLLIEVPENKWIPYLVMDERIRGKEDDALDIEVEIGAIDDIRGIFKEYSISQLTYFKEKEDKATVKNRGSNITRAKDFNGCIALSKACASENRIDEQQYKFNMEYNSCWGKKLAITKDGKIRPCIYSEIEIGDIKDGNIGNSIERAKEYWQITKDKVNTCKICELRYACFDCREIALKMTRNIFACNPFCTYNPRKGMWEK
ncbi:MAG: hypothetical protein IMZ53_06915, partial [Thermoplasmata archaeon]|nr:hypothetical protein [Thermoplasmata archaeon]